jgi:photosystem II stability/assembly factor-like uncharacterized protein
MRIVLFALTVCFCVCTITFDLKGQTNHKWETTIVCDKCTPVGFGYGDSTHSVIPVKFGYKNSNSVMYTKDAGKTWARSDTFYYYFNMPGDFDFLTFFPPSTYYMFNSVISYYSSDEGKSWIERGGLDNTQAVRMFSPEKGYLLFRGGNTYQLRATFDSAYFWIDRISEWDGNVSQLLMLDSLNMWKVGQGTLARTGDAGVSWQELNPYPDRKYPTHGYILSTRDLETFYVIGGPSWDTTFLLVTTDNGLSWKHTMESSMNRIVRIAEQGKDSLWLLVSRKKMGPRLVLYDANAPRGQFADSIFFTTDAGATWQADMTFEGDSILDLQFHNGIGYLVSIRDSMVKFSRYIPGSASVSPKDRFDQTLEVYPNPASTEIMFYPQLGGECKLRLLDVFGRAVFEEDVSLQHMQPSKLALPDYLPNGLYFLELARGDARAGQRFIIQR